MELGYGFLAALGCAHVFLSMGVQMGTAGVDQRDRAFRDASVRALMSLDVRGLHKIIYVLRCLLGHVNDNARPDQLTHRQLVGGQRAFGEVDGGVEMGAAMLGCRGNYRRYSSSPHLYGPQKRSPSRTSSPSAYLRMRFYRRRYTVGSDFFWWF